MKIQKVKISAIIGTIERFAASELEEYQQLKESIRKFGVLVPVILRKQGEFYSILDGWSRVEACHELGIMEVSANVLELSESQMLEIQLMKSVRHIKTDEATYRKNLLRIVNMNPELRLNELAKKLSKSTTWILDKLGMTQIREEVISAALRDEISLSTAYLFINLDYKIAITLLPLAIELGAVGFKEYLGV